MCYMLVLSTSSQIDLTQYNNESIQFLAILHNVPEEKYLQFKNKWFISADHGCSCGFRHLYTESIDLGFGEPEDWYPENIEELQSTRQFIQVVRALVEKNEDVDCVDAWCGDQEETKLDGDIDIHLHTISDTSFRFFENYRFNFLNQ